jgi:hypothetical protein
MPGLPVNAPVLRSACAALLLGASLGAHAQALAGPTLEAMGRGDTLTGTVPAGEAPLVPIPLLAGDEVDVVLQGTGHVELESFDPAGKPIGRSPGEGAVSSHFKTTQDGVAFVAILAEPGSSYSLSIKRVVTGRPPPPPVDPNWGNYARMDGLTRFGDHFTIRWHWETPGQVMLEEWTRSGKDKVIYTARITRGDGPGILLMTDGKREWPGSVGSDGTVSWAHGSSMIALPFNLLLLEDGRIRRDFLKKDGTLKFTDWYVPEGVAIPGPQG